MTKKVVLVFAAMLAAVPFAPAVPTLTLTPLGTLSTGVFRDEDPRNAEINAFDPVARRIYVVNPMHGRLDIIDAGNPAAPAPAMPASVDIAGACHDAWGEACPVGTGAEANSVAVHGQLLAVALTNAVRTDNGHAVFFTLNGSAAPAFLAAIEVGAGPDMIAFTADGTHALTADEGEPNADYTIDPPGSISIIEVAKIGSPGAVRRAGFEKFDHPQARAKLLADGVRIFGPGASVSQDLEPEYIAIEGNRAYVTLQENNALAIVNIQAAEVVKIVGLGLKDHSLPGNDIDPTDTGGAISIGNWPVHGMYQPDAIAAFTVKGRPFLIMANEGDAREYTGTPGFVEARRLSSAQHVLDPIVFPNAADLKVAANMGRLNVSRATGDLDGDGDYDRIDAFGARSISVRDHQGRLVWDSGDLFEYLSRDNHLAGINIFHTSSSSNAIDNRSDDKGVEPESVVVGTVNGRLYAFVGLERDSGIAVFDVSQPDAPAFVTYVHNRKFPTNPATGGAFLPCSTNDCGDLGPEGLTFVPAGQSPTTRPLLIVSNEVSSTTTIWEIE